MRLGLLVLASGLALGLAALVMVGASYFAAGGGLVGAVLAVVFLSLAGVLALAGNALYLAGLWLRPLGPRLLGVVTLFWGLGHLVVAVLGVPLRDPYESWVRLALGLAGAAYLALGFLLSLSGYFVKSNS